jgi:hypothetical protein
MTAETLSQLALVVLGRVGSYGNWFIQWENWVIRWGAGVIYRELVYSSMGELSIRCKNWGIR